MCRPYTNIIWTTLHTIVPCSILSLRHCDLRTCSLIQKTMGTLIVLSETQRSTSHRAQLIHWSKILSLQFNALIFRQMKHLNYEGNLEVIYMRAYSSSTAFFLIDVGSADAQCRLSQCARDSRWPKQQNFLLPMNYHGELILTWEDISINCSRRKKNVAGIGIYLYFLSPFTLSKIMIRNTAVRLILSLHRSSFIPEEGNVM